MLFCLNLILCIVYIRRHTGHRHKMQLQVIELSKCTYCVLQASLVTCRILAGWPLRNPVTAPRSSRHQSENRPIFFARSRSTLVLKPLTVFAITESLSSIFHLDTTRWEKKYFLISLLHRHLTNFPWLLYRRLFLWNFSLLMCGFELFLLQVCFQLSVTTSYRNTTILSGF